MTNYLTLGRKRKVIPPPWYKGVVDEGLPPSPLGFLICCNISKRFFLQWKAFELLYKIRYILLVVTLLKVCDVTKHGHHLGFYQELEILKMKKWSSQWTRFMQLRKEARKKNSGLQRGLNPWPRDYRCDALPTELWSPQASLRNCINCVHCDDHFFIFTSFPQFLYNLFHVSLTLISFTGTYETTIDLLPTSEG